MVLKVPPAFVWFGLFRFFGFCLVCLQTYMASSSKTSLISSRFITGVFSRKYCHQIFPKTFYLFFILNVCAQIMHLLLQNGMPLALETPPTRAIQGISPKLPVPRGTISTLSDSHALVRAPYNQVCIRTKAGERLGCQSLLTLAREGGAAAKRREAVASGLVF